MVERHTRERVDLRYDSLAETSSTVTKVVFDKRLQREITVPVGPECGSYCGALLETKHISLIHAGLIPVEWYRKSEDCTEYVDCTSVLSYGRLNTIYGNFVEVSYNEDHQTVNSDYYTPLVSTIEGVRVVGLSMKSSPSDVYDNTVAIKYTDDAWFSYAGTTEELLWHFNWHPLLPSPRPEARVHSKEKLTKGEFMSFIPFWSCNYPPLVDETYRLDQSDCSPRTKDDPFHHPQFLPTAEVPQGFSLPTLEYEYYEPPNLCYGTEEDGSSLGRTGGVGPLPGRRRQLGEGGGNTSRPMAGEVEGRVNVEMGWGREEDMLRKDVIRDVGFKPVTPTSWDPEDPDASLQVRVDAANAGAKSSPPMSGSPPLPFSAGANISPPI